MSDENNPIHSIYLPFSRKQLAPHFSDEKHLDYFATSAIRYSEFMSRFGANLSGMPITREVRLKRQVEKDERFWTACVLKSIFDAGKFAEVLRISFGDVPPLRNFNSWEECLGKAEDQALRFEVAVSSPVAYRESLRARFLNSCLPGHLIPYVADAGKGRTTYEGPTIVDAVLVSRTTGFSVMFEAKVLSDISCDVTFDPIRNQLARNIDVMLDTGHTDFLLPDPSKRLLALLTPSLFKEKRSTRYYGMLFNEYKRNSTLLAEHLGHRDASTLETVPCRLGWLTFEECLGVCANCCPWLHSKRGHS